MKTSYFLLITLLWAYPLYAQINESFTDGNFTQNPPWQGDSIFYKVSANNELQSNGPAANATLALSTPSSFIINTSWEFYTRQEFEPSTSNYAKVYLTSDQADLKGALNGYYLKLGGESGTNDKLELYRQEGMVSTKILTGISGNMGRLINKVRIKMIRDIEGYWYLFSDTTGQQQFSLEASGFDDKITGTAYFGFSCIHTSTRKDKFFFDDILIKEAPFMITKLEVKTANQLSLLFNKPSHSSSVLSAINYVLTGFEGNITQIIPGNTANEVIIQLSSSLTRGNYILQTSNLFSPENKALEIVTGKQFTYTPSLNYGDLLITEIMADPEPSAGLPEKEFVELYNNSDDTIFLKQYTLSDGTSTATFPDIQLAPEKYLIVCSSSSTADFVTYGTVTGPSGFPSLNNSGDHLSIKDPKGKLIFELAYKDTWYKDDQKKEGGWTLEMVNPLKYCEDESNWMASKASIGGTPGKQNSTYENQADTDPPIPLKVFLTSADTLVLAFNEKISSSITLIIESISPALSYDIPIISNQKPYNILIPLKQPPQKNIYYQIQFRGISDCYGNYSDMAYQFPFLLPESPDSLDLIINEVLFNPLPGGVDFVEIYNPSEKYLSLQDCRIANASEVKKITSDYSIIIAPKTYKAISVNSAIVKNFYPKCSEENLITIPSMPSYNDDQGIVRLLNKDNKVLDYFEYNENLHLSLISDPEGVSLERLSPSNSSMDPNNWHSTAATENYATPGYKNSQSTYINNSGISIEPKVFSPNQDSYKDFMLLNYRFSEPGFIANILIFDKEGRSIKTLSKNQIMSNEGFVRWDGTDENQKLVPIGYYIIWMEAFSLKGEVKTFKDSVVVAY